MLTDNIPCRFGLKETTIKKINSIFTQHPEIEKAVLYGSRAKGNYQCGSDIDLTLIGSEKLTFNKLGGLETEIDDLLLPYKIDLSLYRQIENLDLLEHIERVGKVFYARAQEF